MMYPRIVPPLSRTRLTAMLLASFTIAGVLAQEEASEEEIYELSPFNVTVSENEGYRATHTLAGTRINTELKDVGSAISVVTKDFLEDIGATDNTSLLTFTTGTEVGGTDGNFAGAGNGSILFESFQSPSSNTRVRGLSSADNTIDFYLTKIPWDSYNVDRIDVQRGPNSILFGFGSPAGIINASRIKPKYSDEGKVSLRFDGEGSVRTAIDFNKEILEDELAFRVAVLNDLTKFRQDPAFDDDRRLFATIQYEPKFLNSDSARTSLVASYESGDIDANRPRAITPIDTIKPWFRAVDDPTGGLGKGTFSPIQINVGTPLEGQTNVGQLNQTFNDGSVNPDYLPSLGTFPQSYGGVLMQFDGASGALTNASQTETQNIIPRGIDSTGAIDGTIGGLPYQRPGAVDRYTEIARKLGLPFEEFGQYKNQHLLDPSIFDFWNQHIDGQTKSEAQKWNHVTASLSQTLFNNKLGFELSVDRQEYDQTREQLFSGGRLGINVDVNTLLADGTPNPNLGRPFITDTGQFGQRGDFTSRDSFRFTAYAENDFTADGSNDSWWRKALGRQVFTGLVSSEESDEIQQQWNAYGTSDAYGNFIGQVDTADNIRQINPTVYLGPSLLGASSAAGANIPRVGDSVQVPTSFTARVFDSTWNGAGVDPAAPYDSNGDGTLNSTQSENPANYVGWVNREMQLLSAADGDRETLVRQYDHNLNTVDSEALVLQNYFWGGAVVGTYGWRKDVAESFSSTADLDPDTRRVLIDSAVLPDEPVSQVDVQSTSWSVATHVNELFGLNDVLPVNISLYYNESENFQPSAGRIDIYGRPLSSPSGKTIDRSILISSKDNKYSFKVTRFTTSVVNDSASSVAATWFIGQIQNRGDNAADKFEFDVAGGSVGAPNQGNTYQPRPGQTVEEAAAEEAAAVAGWRALQQDVFALSEELAGDPHAFYKAWGSDPANTPPQRVATLRTPNGFAITQDALSEGYEYEFSAQPLDNWRLTFNASQVEAVRNNIGGEAFIRHVELLIDGLNNTPAGNLRTFGSGANAETQLRQFNRIFAGNWALTKLLEGTASPELREWRFNAVTNYRFSDGALKGWNIGAGYRWQDDVVIGYPVIAEAGGDPVFDLENPFVGPSLGNVDLWVGHARKLNDRVKWRMQLNVRNAFADKDLIPISAMPDGSPAGVRLGAATSWTLSNTFEF